jgi:DNA (cytosine-5)-methyltransferase 1
MKTVELFAGIGGFRLAADRCGYKTIWANDFCPRACQVYADKFGVGEIVQGDINKLLDTVPKHELLTAGFPCQPFSSAGKKQGIKDPRGTLFNSIVNVIARRRPKYFVLENVKRLLTMENGVHFATILSSLAKQNYRIEWRLLSALDFGLAQNRERVVIVGIRERKNTTNPFFENERFRSITTNHDDLKAALNFDLKKAQTTSDWTKIERHGVKFPNWGIAWNGNFYTCNLPKFSEQSKPIFLKSVLQDPEKIDDQFDFTKSTVSRIKDSVSVNKFVRGVEILSNQSGGARMGYTVFGVNGVAPTLTATPSRHYERYKVNGNYRRLTNVEYARLQGFPDNHCSAVSVYHQYALYGNAVPPILIKWVLQRLENAGIRVSDLPKMPIQGKLFANA